MIAEQSCFSCVGVDSNWFIALLSGFWIVGNTSAGASSPVKTYATDSVRMKIWPLRASSPKLLVQIQSTMGKLPMVDLL